jgi:hypothetical protein
MRGEIVFRVYGVHSGRAEDAYFSAFRSRAEAEAEVARLSAREIHGRNWAAQYHDKGFVIREHVVETNFEIASRPKPRDRYVVKLSARPNAPGTWDSTLVEVLRRRSADDLEHVCTYERNYAMLQTFEPFRQKNHELALISRAAAGRFSISICAESRTGSSGATIDSGTSSWRAVATRHHA